MRLQPRTWLVISVLSLVGAAVFWRLGEQRLARRMGAPRAVESGAPSLPAAPASTLPLDRTTAVRVLRSERDAAVMPTALSSAQPTGQVATSAGLNKPADLRVRNTTKPVNQLLRDDRALVLRNAYIDTTERLEFGIPAHLKSGPEPGAFIVQAKGAITPSFKEAIEAAGGSFVSYLPNNAYLVRASSAQAAALKESAAVAAVLPYEPYYKLETSLLSKAVSQQPLQQDTRLNLTLLPGTRAEAIAELQTIGSKVVSDFKTPFGPGVVVEVATASLARIAQVPSVQEVELFRQRRLLNDLSRWRLGISSETNVPGVFSNRFNLTGTNVVFNLNDSGVDASHPDLQGRVTADFPSTLVDFDGHGTHTAGTIIGNGSMSGTVSNAPGSTVPGSDFRGMAPQGEIFALPIDLVTGPLLSDAYIQERAATNYYVERGLTNFPISNNSWGYIGDSTYNGSSASYDAAVRDALPEMSGNQPILYVFSAGNSGFGNEGGLEGNPNTIGAPGTAKNVITVGAIESPRNITNEVIYPDPADPSKMLTNQVFLAGTDSDYQVASFSSRGNVEPGVEGTYGRFKPDVVAPGVFTLSTRSSLWEDPTAEYAASVNYQRDQEVKPGELQNYSLFVPRNTYQFYVDVLPNDLSPIPFPTLPLYLKYGDFPGLSDLVSMNNSFAVPPDRPLVDGFWYYAAGNQEDSTVSYDIRSVLIVTNVPGNYYSVLKNLNDGVGPYYRYESGTSMAAPAVTGLLGLFLDYFQKQGQPVSPALLKALLINGSRSLGSLYNYAVRDVVNHQGWGVANLTNALPAVPFGVATGAVSLVHFADVTGLNSLTTGDSRSWSLDIDPEAVNRQLKITLVWTDPPGNPSAGAKLVNDLDLVLRSGETNQFFLGNDLQFGDDFNTEWQDANSGTNDIINNVETILIRAPLKTNYVLTVKGKRVNVNAVAEHPDGIAQDFALVASLSGQASTTNVFKVTPITEPALAAVPEVRVMLNGVEMPLNRVGAKSPGAGTTPGTFKQWNFFVFTNSMASTPEGSDLTNGQYVGFFVIGEANLSSPRSQGPDVDLYVSDNPALTNLNPAVLEASWRPLVDGHALESVALTNAGLGTVYYAAVKAEDQMGGGYSLYVNSSDVPFDQDDGRGNRIVYGRPFRVPIPDGSAARPQAGYVFGQVTVPFKVKRVVVTNILEFDSTGDIVSKLGHGNQYVVLNNHALDPGNRAKSARLVYDDSGAGDVSFGSILGQPTDGPGSLMDFVGEEAAGPWVLTLVDNAIAQTATNRLFAMWVEKQPELGEWITVVVPPFGWERSSWEVPSGATELKVTLSKVDPPVDQDVYIRRAFPPTLSQFDKNGTILGSIGGSVSLGLRDPIPLNNGLYHVGIYNPNPVTVTYSYRVDITVGPFVPDRSFDSDLPLAVTDDARQISTIKVGDDREIVDVKVGLRVDHPRISDLVFHLISPRGTRLLLSENRGGPSGTAYGATLGLKKVFTTFTDDTNLTVTPIKYGIPPFTNSATASTASNRIVFADGFESAVPGLYSFGQPIPVGWQVAQGTATVLRVPLGDDNILEGRQYLLLGSVTSSVGTTVQLGLNQSYRLRFAAAKTVAGGQQSLAVYVNGNFQQEIRGDTHPDGWYRDVVIFRAPADLCVVEFRTVDGRSPLAVDDIVIQEEDPPFNAYYLPEEEMEPLLGQRALGDWKLEVVDTRLGPTNSGPAQVDWRLEFVYALPSIEAIELTNGVPYFGSVNGNDVKYFFTQVPACATISRSIIAGEFATLLLFGDHDGLPYADVDSFQDDYGPYLNLEPGGIAQFFLTTNFPAPAPLRPGQRYYLAVRNYLPDLTNNAFGIMVNFDCDDPPLPVVDSLFSGIPRTNTIAAGPALQYYQFVVSSNAIRAEFELTPINGNVDMYIRQGRVGNFPVPSPSVYDYKSDDPDPAVVDFVNVDRTSPPVGLTPGVWYVAVRNGETFPVDYTIKATEFTAQIINLTNAIPYTNTIAAVDPAIGLLGEDLQYYAFLVSPDSIRANFETFGADGDVNLYLRKTLPIPTPIDFDLASQNPGVADEFIAVTNTATPIWLSPGWWFLSVENADITNVTYSIKATEFPATIIPLTNNVAFTNVIAPGTSLDYYSFLVSTQVLSAKFEVFGMTDDVQLLLRQGLPVPTFNDFHYASTNAGLANEEIALTPYSFPTTLTPGNWYLSIANASSNNATYVVRASEETALVIPLTNGVPYNASLLAGPGVDYFQFTVSSNATAAEFKVTSAGTGDLDLYLKKGPPLPNALNATYSSARNGTVDEVIQIDTNSFPVPVSPGIWYLMVTNKDLATVSYEITATEFGVEPPPNSGQVTNLVITTTNVCITWISIPGTNYYVVAKSNALDAAWTPISPTIAAVDTSTTWCLEPPGPWRFFDVFEGESPISPIPAPVPVIRLDGTNICVSWSSVVGTNYFVQGKKAFEDPNWDTLTPSIVATATTMELCYPIAWGYRFFRVGVGSQAVPVPTPVPADQLEVDVTVDNICLTWPTKAGLDYLVEGKRLISDANWTVVSEARRGDGNPMTLCLGGATEFRYFRVIEGVTVPLGPPASVPVPNVSLSVDAAFQLCLTWDTLVGAEYFVEGKERASDAVWTVVSPILQATGIELSYCQALGSDWRYLQVRRVNIAPEPPVEIDVIEVMPAGLRLSWTGTPGSRYQVFYSDIIPVIWVPIGGAVTSVTSDYQFIDDGTLTGGFPGFRMYRIQRLP